MPKTILTFSFLLFTIWGYAQNTIGLTAYTADSENGYTLFSPNQSNDVFLIDNCGQLVHSWTTNVRPGLSCYLLENGNLLRTKKIVQPYFNGGGVGGGLEIIDWDSNVIWSYDVADSLQCQHHDVEILPNGNVLVIAWDSYTEEQQIQEGRILPKEFLWAEKIVELEPNFDTGGAEIVWEWKVWDHMIQNADASLDNFGIVSQHPELIDINYDGITNQSSDWLHFNSLDYNEDLDQIVISVHHNSEIWIIDHSTTTEEAAGHSGGLSGKGGDLLYRWGNPVAYQQGTSIDQKLFKQHDAYWISDSLVHGGMIMFFNNQRFSPLEASSVDVIEPPLNGDGSYALNGDTYLPQSYHWSYVAENQTDFYSQRISGAQRLTNGNTLICEGGNGRLFEVDIDGNIVWEYINPVAQGQILTQGDIPMGNNVFRVYRYPEDYPAFQDKLLEPQGYVEQGSDFDCELFSDVAVVGQKADWELFPNPTTELLNLRGLDDLNLLRVELLDLSGKLLYSEMPSDDGDGYTLDVADLSPGLYFIRLHSDDGVSSKKFIKQ